MERIRRTLLTIVAAVLAPGCLEGGPSLEPSHPDPPPSVVDAFPEVTWSPERPASGEGVLIRSRVDPQVPRESVQCRFLILSSAGGSGLTGGTGMTVRDDGWRECRIPPGYPSDTATFYLTALHEGRLHRSAFHVVSYEGGPGEGRPETPIDALRVDPAPSGNGLALTVDLRDDLGAHLPDVSAAMTVDLHDLNDPPGFSQGVRLDRTGPLRFEGVAFNGTPWSLPRGDAYVVFAFAESENGLGGVTHAGWIERGFGRCADLSCVVRPRG